MRPCLAFSGDRIDVTINKDGSLTVEDHGRGMPTGMHAMGIPTVEVIFTILHAGGKFGQGGYKTSGGSTALFFRRECLDLVG